MNKDRLQNYNVNCIPSTELHQLWLLEDAFHTGLTYLTILFKIHAIQDSFSVGFAEHLLCQLINYSKVLPRAY